MYQDATLAVTALEENNNRCSPQLVERIRGIGRKMGTIVLSHISSALCSLSVSQSEPHKLRNRGENDSEDSSDATPHQNPAMLQSARAQDPLLHFQTREKRDRKRSTRDACRWYNGPGCVETSLSLSSAAIRALGSGESVARRYSAICVAIFVERVGRKMRVGNGRM